jgi:hypothetical protein
MEKRELTLQNTILDNVLTYLYDQVKTRGALFNLVDSKITEYPDGTKKKFDYHHNITSVQSTKNNTITINVHFYMEDTVLHAIPSPGHNINYGAIVFKLWPLHTNTVLIKVDFVETYQGFVDEILSDLTQRFEQEQPKKGTGRPPDPKYIRIYDAIKSGTSKTTAMIDEKLDPCNKDHLDKVNHAIGRIEKRGKMK